MLLLSIVKKTLDLGRVLGGDGGSNVFSGGGGGGGGEQGDDSWPKRNTKVTLHHSCVLFFFGFAMVPHFGKRKSGTPSQKHVIIQFQYQLAQSPIH